MKLLFSLLFSLGLSGFANAHEFFFAYAEFKLNEMEGELQGTLIFTGHDMEKALGIELMSDKGIDTSDREVLINYINQHFSFGSTVSLQYFGHEVKNTGEFVIYLNSPIPTDFEFAGSVRFDLLMDFFPDQQNKLSIMYRNETKHLNFLGHSRTQELKFP